MPTCTNEARERYVDAVLERVKNTSDMNYKPYPMPGHRYGFYLRGEGWSGAFNGFCVTTDCHPRFVVRRNAQLQLNEESHRTEANNGPNPDKADYIDFVFVEQHASTGVPDPAFLDRLVSIIRSATMA